MLAGVVEHLCFHDDVAIPAWVMGPGRFLDHWWFVTPYRSLHPSAFVETPAALGNRGVFIHGSSVERDADDIEALYRLSGFSSVEEALDHVRSLYPHQPVPPRAQCLLLELFPADDDQGPTGVRS